MPKTSASWVAKPGWEHRAFLGLGPVTDEQFEAHAAEYRWSAEELEARKQQGYMQAGTAVAEEAR
jgi:hypothetical protein